MKGKCVLILPTFTVDTNGHFVFVMLKLKNKPGVAEKLARVLAKHNVNILSGVHNANGDVATWLMQLDFKGATTNPGDVLKEVEGLSEVLECKWGVERLGSFVFTPFPVRFGVANRELVLFRAEFFGSLAASLIERFGTGGAALLFHMGREAGLRACKMWKEETGFKGRDFVNFCLSLIKSMGWISSYSLSTTGGELKVTVKELFECKSVRGVLGLVREPTGHYFRGLLSAILSEGMEERVGVLEERCIAMGDSECVFRAKTTRE